MPTLEITSVSRATAATCGAERSSTGMMPPATSYTFSAKPEVPASWRSRTAYSLSPYPMPEM